MTDERTQVARRTHRRASSSPSLGYKVKGLHSVIKSRSPPIPPKLGAECSNPGSCSSRLHPKPSPAFRDREKAQLPQAFAQRAWGLESGTFRQIALRMATCLRSLRVGHFTLQAFLRDVSRPYHRCKAGKSASRSPVAFHNRRIEPTDLTSSRSYPAADDRARSASSA
jgi:hypothetical protein